MKTVLCAINSRYNQTSPAIRSLALSVGPKFFDSRTDPDVAVAEYATAQPIDVIARDLFVKAGDLYAFSVYIWNRRQTFDVIAQLRAMRPDILIIAGGPEVSFDQAAVLEECPALDMILSGEGERPFARLLARLSTDPRPGMGGEGAQTDWLADIPALAWRDRDRIVVNPPDPDPLDLSTLPFPYEDDLERMTERILYYESSRGCPFRCAYCLSSIEKQVRFRPLPQTLSHFDRFIDAGARLVKLVDRTFNCDPQRARVIWRHLVQRYQDRPFDTVFHFEIAGDLLANEDIELLGSAPKGLFQLEIGVQSTNPTTLSRINRACDLEKLSQRVRQLVAAGRQHLHLDLIAGLPGERLEQVIQSFNDLYALSTEHLQLGFLKLLPGTPVLREIGPCRYRYQPFPPYEVVSTRDISAGELCRLHEIEDVLELFANSGLFFWTLPFLVRQFDSPYVFFEALADERAEAGDAGRPLSTDDRAILVSRFAGNRLTPALKQVVDGLLRLDHYRNGRKDPPAGLGALEASADPVEKSLIDRLRRSMLPGRRIRIESVPFSVRHLFEHGVLMAEDLEESPGGGKLRESGEWIVYDLSGPGPRVHQVLPAPPRDPSRLEKWFSNAAMASS